METEEERRIRRRKRLEEMKREKRKTEMIYRWGVPAVSLAVLAAAGIWVGSSLFSSGGDDGQAPEEYGGTRTLTLQDIEANGISGADRGEAARGENNGNPEGMSSGADSSGEGGAGNPGGNGDDGAGTGSVPDRKNSRESASSGRQNPEAESGTEGLITATRRKGNPRSLQEAGFPEEGEAVPISGPAENMPVEGEIPLSTLAGKTPYFEAHDSESTLEFDETIISQYGVLIDVEDAAVLAQKGAHERMNPASMTKVLTLLVAAEHLTEEDLDKTVQITIDITDYCYINECSVTGYALNEIVPVRDLLYGTILPSGADSSVALANYVAGSHEAFVEMMNDKVEELGLAESTHFTNCVGLYDEDHYTTAYDMAVILKAAADNALCRDVLSAHTYTTTFTEQHPEGLVISNWFLRRIEDRDTHGEVLCGKTGYVDQSGSCAASLARGSNGREYLCVTANSTSKWNCISDQVALYQSFIPEAGGAEGTENEGSDTPDSSGEGAGGGA